MAVHIADPTSFISLGSNLDFNASLRSVTYYYPNKGFSAFSLFSIVYPLFPWEIATACSLSTTQFLDSRPDNRFNPVSLDAAVPTQKTPLPRALTITMEFGENGSIVDYSISCTTLKRPIRLTYEEVEAILNASATEKSGKEQEKKKKKKKVFVSSSSVNSDSFPLHSISSLKLSNPSSIEPNASILGFQGSSTSSPSLDGIFNRVTSPQLSREEITSTLESLYRLAKKRRAYRERKGSIDFSFSEARFHVQDGVVDGSIATDDVSMKVRFGFTRLCAVRRARDGNDGGRRRNDRAAREGGSRRGERRDHAKNIPLPYRSHPYNMILPADQMQMRHIHDGSLWRFFNPTSRLSHSLSAHCPQLGAAHSLPACADFPRRTAPFGFRNRRVRAGHFAPASLQRLLGASAAQSGDGEAARPLCRGRHLPNQHALLPNGEDEHAI